MKRIFGLIMAFGLAMTLMTAPAKAAQVETEPEGIAMNQPSAQEINITISGNDIRVTGAAKQTLVIYYITGTKATSYTIETDDQTFSTSLGKGVYLCKIGKFVRKVSIS